MSTACNSLVEKSSARRVACAALLCMLSTSLVHAAAKTGKAEVSASLVTVPAVPVIPSAAQTLFDAAMRALQAGQSEQASLSLQELAVSYPAYASPLINLGLMEQKADRHESAIAYFQRALERDAKSALANTSMGVSYRHLGKLKEAEAAYRAALMADASYAPAHLNLGILYDVYLQQLALAVQEYETYQTLLTTPDTKVAAWIKDLKGRVNIAAKSNAGVQP